MAIAHLTLATRNVERTSAFFQSVFGWRPIRRPQNIRCRADWLEITPGQELHLLEIADFGPSPFEREFGRHIAFELPAAEFSALQRRLAQAGAELIPPERPTPFERFFFRSPDGYVFEVMDSGRTPEI